MLNIDNFNALLQQRGALIIDGGLATELESRDHDLNHALWSGKILKEQPEAIEDVHLGYYLAGATIAITASYQASVQGFESHFGMSENESIDIVKRSVQLAQNARNLTYTRQDQAGRKLLVAGSVGPYGAFLADGSEYRGDYKRSKQELQDFHRPRIRALVDAGVDLLAIETMPQLAEIEALLEMLRSEFPASICWISCTLADSGHISDGTCIEQVLRVVNEYRDVVVAFGVNCVSVGLVTDALLLMKRRTKLPLLCYPNSGEVWDAETKTWSDSGAKQQDLIQHVREWKESGACLIGGCCRTGPKEIGFIASTLSQ